MGRKLLERMCRSKLIAVIAGSVTILIPAFKKFKRYKNLLVTIYSSSLQKPITKNNPVAIRIAPITVCNYRCLFCEIHKDNLLYPNRQRNIADLNLIQNYESFLSTAFNLYFCGGSEEPLLNQNLTDIIKYLKSKYGTRMGVNTNASVLNQNLVGTMIKYEFDSILVSYHAGSKEGYKELMTGEVEKVDENLAHLKRQKERLGKEKPVVEFNFALQKLNKKEYPFVIKKAKKLGASAILITKYYGGRNRLQDRKVSYDYDIKEGNDILDAIYACAKKENVNLIPSKPQY